MLNRASTGNNHVFLTLLGGRAFGNKETGIIKTIRRVLQRVSANFPASSNSHVFYANLPQPAAV